MSGRSRDHQFSLGRRSFLGGTAAILAACGGQLVTTKYPSASRCSAAGCTMVDAHCHIFNASDLNISGFISHVLPVPKKLTTRLTDFLAAQLQNRAPTAKEEIAYLQSALQSGQRITASASALPADNMRDVAARLVAEGVVVKAGSTSADALETIKLIIQRRTHIAVKLSETYSQIDLFTPALVDYAYWSPDHAKSPLADQLAVQSLIARASTRNLMGREGVRIHPMAPFNPLREVRDVILPGKTPYRPLGPWQPQQTYSCDAPRLAEAPKEGSLGPLRHAIENLGFIGAKVYPPTGFKPFDNDGWSHHHDDTKLGVHLDQALAAFYAYCEAEEVPVLTHANNSNGYNLGYGLLTDPDVWEQVLNKYPRLRLNLGHFGELEGDDPDRGIEACELWMRKIARLMTRFPNVYADCGCSIVPVDQKAQDRYLTLLEVLYEEYPAVANRFMFGTDFWLNKFFANSGAFLNTFAHIYKKRFATHYDNFFGTNALRFYGFLDDDGKKPAANRNRLRLKAWYEDTPQPAWLAD